MNFTFACLNDTKNCKTASGNYSIGIWEIENEDYSHLKHCLQLIINNLEAKTSIELNGVEFKLEFYFGGDMKFLLNIYGECLIALFFTI